MLIDPQEMTEILKNLLELETETATKLKDIERFKAEAISSWLKQCAVHK